MNSACSPHHALQHPVFTPAWRWLQGQSFVPEVQQGVFAAQQSLAKAKHQPRSRLVVAGTTIAVVIKPDGFALQVRKHVDVTSLVQGKDGCSDTSGWG